MQTLVEYIKDPFKANRKAKSRFGDLPLKEGLVPIPRHLHFPLEHQYKYKLGSNSTAHLNGSTWVDSIPLNGKPDGGGVIKCSLPEWIGQHTAGLVVRHQNVSSQQATV